MQNKSNNHASFTRKREAFFPFQFVFLGYLLILFGLYLLVSLNLWGLLAIAGGLFISFSSIGVQINFEKYLYREYFAVLNLKTGPWKTLEKVQYVTVFIDNTIQEMHVTSISSTQKIKDFKVNLIISKTSRIEIGRFKDRNKAIKTARHLASQLHCKLLDYNTSGKPVWIEPTA